MILPVAVARGVAAGEIDRAYRRWSTSRVRPGSTLRTAAGVVEIVAVDEIDPSSITDDDARAAGAASAAVVRGSFRGSPGDPVFRIRLRAAGPDPRVALRDEPPTGPGELDELVRRLDRLDRASRHGSWTRATLRCIAAHPGERAADLARRLGRERDPLKLDVRKLTNLGLTESLGTGYRVSPRGESFLATGR
ncbi:hypothetical protein [Pseudonocardia sp. NPDC049635]|uniref:hypothetical protein n=1 Tax=Pseudonocardia sp. NPDC049635 TaxID=3155506 RepID=UPI0033F37A3C